MNATVEGQVLEVDLSALPPAGFEDMELGAEQGARQDEAAAAELRGEPTPEEQAHLETVGMAAMFIEVGAGVVAKRWPAFTFTNPEKSAVCEKLVPVLKKYDVRSVFFEKYKEEIALGAVLFGLYKAKADALEAAQPKPQEGAGASSATTAHAEPVVQGEPGGDPLAFVRRA